MVVAKVPSPRAQIFLIVVSLALGGVLAACGGGDQPQAPVLVSFRQPTNGAIVPHSFNVKLGVQTLEVEPAGEAREGAGHFHILIDTDFIPLGEVIPDDDQHLHLDDGSTEAEIGLTPGPHVLRVQLADGGNLALVGVKQEERARIVVAVEADAPTQSVRFISPTDGASVPPTIDIVAAATGLVVEVAQEVRADIGHFHILVDADFIEAGRIIPNGEGDERHVHLLKGARRVTLSLDPGPHTLRLQFADGLDTALRGDQYRDEIKVNVSFGQGAQQVMFVEPEEGTTVSQTFTVKTAAVGLDIEPALTGPMIPGLIRAGAGHLHILVNEPFATEVMSIDETHIHLDEGQLSTEMSLEPGTYTLRLQMTDHNHQALAGDQFRYEISITVE